MRANTRSAESTGMIANRMASDDTMKIGTLAAYFAVNRTSMISFAVRIIKTKNGMSTIARRSIA